MLFNPKWQKTADNCEITLAGFTAWVEAQNPKARYDYVYHNKCAVGCWLKATDNHVLLHAHWGQTMPVLWFADRIASKTPHTFGALAKRLRALHELPF